MRWALIAVALVVGALVASSTVRERMLAAGLEMGVGALPGAVTVGQVAWPALGHLRLEHMLWTDGGDNPAVLADITLLEAWVDLGALRLSDVRLDSLRADIAWLDLPGLGRVLVPAAAGEPAGDKPAAGFPRPGSLPKVPSVAVAQGYLELSNGILAPQLSVSALRLEAALEAGHGRPPRAGLKHLTAEIQTSLGLQPGTGPAAVSVRSAVLDLALDAALDSLGQVPWPEATLERLQAEVVVTEPGRWQHLLPAAAQQPGLALEDLGELPLGINLAGSLQADELAGRARVELGPGGWLQTGILAGGGQASLAELRAGDFAGFVGRVDTLAIAVLGSSVHGTGTVQRGEVDLELAVSVADLRLPRLWRPELADVEGRFGFTAGVAGDWSAPAVRLDLAGGASGPDWQVPDLSLTARVDRSSGDLIVRLPRGGRVRGVGLDSLTASLEVSRQRRGTPDRGWLGNDGITARFVIAGRRGADAVSTAGAVELDSLRAESGLRARLDSLYAALQGQEIRVTAPILVTRAADRFEVSYDGGLALPAPDLLARHLPSGWTLPPNGPVVGDLSLTARYAPLPTGSENLAVEFAVDLASTDWLERGLLRGRIVGDLARWRVKDFEAAVVSLDTLAVGLLGTSLVAGGTLDQGRIDLDLQLAAPDGRLAAALRPDLVSDTGVEFAATLHAAGTTRRPEARLDLTASVNLPTMRVPRLALTIEAAADTADVRLSAPAGAAFRGAVIDVLALRLQGSRSPDDSLRARFHLAGRRGPEHLVLGGQAWADSLGRGATRRVQLDSLVVGSGARVMQLERPTTLDLGPGRTELALTPLRLAGDPGFVTLGGTVDESGQNLAAAAALTLSGEFMSRFVPGELWQSGGGNDLSVALETDISGTRTLPRVDGRMKVRLVPRSGESQLGGDLEFSLSPTDTTGLQAQLVLVAADAVLATGSLLVPGYVEAATGRWRQRSGQPARAVIPAQTLRLAPFTRLLPPDMGISGPVTVAADLELPLGSAGTDSAAGSGLATGGGQDGQAKVAGSLQAARLEVRLPNRSRLDVGVDLHLSGPTVDPLLAGLVTVQTGFLRVPELPRNLHPTEASPTLWSQMVSDSLALALNSALAVSDTNGTAAANGGAAGLPRLAINVDIPGNLRVYGYGLDAELAGDLKIDRGVDRRNVPAPRLQGTINTVQGTLKFMNRIFRIERGELRFQGLVPADPQLDLVMETTVSGTLVRILVTGAASSPVIEMTSEPDYEELDIMAVLLFGRPLGELDNDQRGGVQGNASAGQHLRQNLAGLAMVFGTKGLQNQVTSRVGVDMVEVGADAKGANTLMLGTFLNPRLMLKYHQSLEKSGTYFVTIEYTLNRLFRLVSTYGQGGESSGLELRWSRRY